MSACPSNQDRLALHVPEDHGPLTFSKLLDELSPSESQATQGTEQGDTELDKRSNRRTTENFGELFATHPFRDLQTIEAEVRAEKCLKAKPAKQVATSSSQVYLQEVTKTNNSDWAKETAEAHGRIHEAICGQAGFKQWILKGIKSLLEQSIELAGQNPDKQLQQIRLIHASITNIVFGMNWFERLMLGEFYLYLQTEAGIERDNISKNRLVA